MNNLRPASRDKKLKLPEQVVLRAGCKINLYLDVLAKRVDGYHDIDSLFYPLSEPFDTLILEPGSRPGLELICTESSIDHTDNTLSKAWRALAKHAPEIPDLKVVLKKGIPQGAGLGGGSSDAASLLLFLNKFLADSGNTSLKYEKLIQTGATVGADVPFFISNTPAWVSGIGEKLFPTDITLNCSRLLLVCPNVHISTAWAYAELDKKSKILQSIPLTRSALRDSNTVSADEKLYNCFEHVVFKAFPVLKSIKMRLLELGAGTALMSGSGSSIFGLFKLDNDAYNAADVLKADGHDVYVVAVDI